MKIFKLTYNEILKQTKKLSFKICFIIIVLFSLGVPFLYNVFSSGGVNSIFYDGEENEYKSEIIESPKNDQDFLSNDINNALHKLTLEGLKNNPKYSEFNNYLYDGIFNDTKLSIIIDSMIEDKNINYNKIDESFETTSVDYMTMSKNDLKSLKSELDKNVIESLKVANTGDYSWYLKKKIDTLKMNPKLSSTDSKILETYEKLYSLGIKSEDDFRASEGQTIIETYGEMEPFVSEKQFKLMDINMTYKQFSKLNAIKNKELNKRIEKSWYAIDNNINYNNSDVKSNMGDAIKNNGIVLSIIIIVIAGGIVSNEFQKGTIRLLVIRPNKRWKVLLSKLLAVLGITVGLAIISYMLSFIGNGIVFGFKDYAIPNLMVVSGKVTEASFILSNICDMLIELIPILFMGLGAFALSTVINNTAFSVGVSIFVFMGYSLMLLLLQAIGFPFTSYTFLPYLNYAQFIDPISMIDNCKSFGNYYTFGFANMILLAWGLVMYLISNFIFVKKDIKN